MPSHLLGLSLLAMAALDALAQVAPDFTETPDLWAAGAQDWGPNGARCVAITDGVADGKTAIGLNYNQGWEHYLAFPKWRNAGWDLSKAEALEFRVKLPRDTSWRGPNPTLYLRDAEGQFLRIRPAGRESLLGKDLGAWETIRVPLTPSTEWETLNWLGASLARVDWIELAFTGGGAPNVAHCVQIDGVRFLPEQPSYSPPNEEAGDLDVLIIERAPRYERYQVTDYRATEENPHVEVGYAVNKDAKHQPDPGETVTFTARVQNKGKTALGGHYRWLLDGQAVAEADVATLAPREQAAFDWQWSWDPADHDVTFAVEPDGKDYCARNNALTVRTTALQYKFMIERGLVARAESKVNMMGSRSFEDWLQGQVAYMNQLFRSSTYDFAPEGITQRVAVGLFEYVDDGYIPTLGAGPYMVGEGDITVDGGRGCTALDDPWNAGAGAPAFLNFAGRPDDAWLHELSHQIGVIDDYQFITEAEDNHVNRVGFLYARRGLMGGGEVYPHEATGALYCLYSPSDVQGLNATKGKRRGYYGEYLYCMPAQCELLLLDESGLPLPGADVRVYQTDQRVIDDVPEHQGVTDAAGLMPLPNRKAGPFTTETGCTLRDNPFGPIHVVGVNGVFLVTAKVGERELYGFTTVPDFNLEWARGHRDHGVVTVVLRTKGDEHWYSAPPIVDGKPVWDK